MENPEAPGGEAGGGGRVEAVMKNERDG
jgi:hypothetical protein